MRPNGETQVGGNCVSARESAVHCGLEYVASGRPRNPGYQYSCFHDYVLHNGRLLPSQPLTEQERNIVFEAIDRRGGRFPRSRCFSNSQRVIFDDRSGLCRYAEGYFLGKSFPFLHAWVTINNKVVDLTLRLWPRARARLSDRVFGEYPEPVYAYYGIQFETDLVRKYMIRQSKFMSLIDNPEDEWPLIRGERFNG